MSVFEGVLHRTGVVLHRFSTGSPQENVDFYSLRRRGRAFGWHNVICLWYNSAMIRSWLS
jgi:hypothetical protein